MNNNRINSFFKNGISITFGLALAFAGLAASRAVFDRLIVVNSVEEIFSKNKIEVSKKDTVREFGKDSTPLQLK